MIGVRIEPRVKSRTTPTISDGAAGGIVGGPAPADQRVQLIVLPTASAGLANPSRRAAVSFSTTVGWTSDGLGIEPVEHHVLARARAKKRPASGFRPWISKKPTSTAAYCHGPRRAVRQ